MGDRCYLEMTMRKADLQRFAAFVDAKPDEEWWDYSDATENPGVVTCTIYEANYAWSDERQAAAKAGLAFYGQHGEGGEYGSYAFAALNGEEVEVQINHEGYMTIALDDDLRPLDDMDHLREYVAKLHAVKTHFGVKEVHEDGTNSGAGREEIARPDQPQGHQDVSAGVRRA